MSKEPKKSATWYIAATHYITAGFAFPFIVGLVLGFGVQPIITDPVLFMGIASVAQIAALWFGVMYSANYLKKAYIIPDVSKVITLATIYFVVVRGLFVALAIMGALALEASAAGIPGTVPMVTYMAAEFLVGLAVFYFASKKYLKASVPAEIAPAA